MTVSELEEREERDKPAERGEKVREGKREVEGVEKRREGDGGGENWGKKRGVEL